MIIVIFQTNVTVNALIHSEDLKCCNILIISESHDWIDIEQNVYLVFVITFVFHL